MAGSGRWGAVFFSTATAELSSSALAVLSVGRASTRPRLGAGSGALRVPVAPITRTVTVPRSRSGWLARPYAICCVASQSFSARNCSAPACTKTRPQPGCDSTSSSLREAEPTPLSFASTSIRVRVSGDTLISSGRSTSSPSPADPSPKKSATRSWRWTRVPIASINTMPLKIEIIRSSLNTSDHPQFRPCATTYTGLRLHTTPAQRRPVT